MRDATDRACVANDLRARARIQHHPAVPRLPSLLTAALALACLSSCRTQPEPTLIVHAAASLTESLTAVSDAWTADGNGEVTLVFGATSQLARGLQSGAPADVFISADAAWMDTLAAADVIRSGSRRELLGNRLVVVVPRDAAFVPRTLAELASAQLHVLALAGEHVPAGRYADAVLRRSGAADAVTAKINRGDSVRTVLHWVAAGEADAGFVYATDALAEDRVEVAFEIPSDLQPVITYPIAIVGHAEHADAAAQFLEFCSSPEARALFERAGFVVLGR